MSTITSRKQVRIDRIRVSRPPHAPADSPYCVCAVLLCAMTGELRISATLDHILTVVEERGWEIVSIRAERRRHDLTGC